MFCNQPSASHVYAWRFHAPHLQRIRGGMRNSQLARKPLLPGETSSKFSRHLFDKGNSLTSEASNRLNPQYRALFASPHIIREIFYEEFHPPIYGEGSKNPLRVIPKNSFSRNRVLSNKRCFGDSLDSSSLSSRVADCKLFHSLADSPLLKKVCVVDCKLPEIDKLQPFLCANQKRKLSDSIKYSMMQRRSTSLLPFAHNGKSSLPVSHSLAHTSFFRVDLCHKPLSGKLKSLFIGFEDSASSFFLGEKSGYSLCGRASYAPHASSLGLILPSSPFSFFSRRSASSFFSGSSSSFSTSSSSSSPLPPAPKPKASVLGWLFQYLWPADVGFRFRVVGSMACLISSKIATIQAPILLGLLVDHCMTDLVTLSGGAAAISGGALLMGPLGLILAYSLTRICASGFGELRNALFATVSQSACRIISCDAFKTLHSTDMDFLLSNKAGELSTVLSRGVKSITQLLNVLLFQVAPTILEFALVLYIMAVKVGVPLALITCCTMATYAIFTLKVTTRRTKIRKRMNQAEQKASGLMFDSLINAESIRYFTAEKIELKRYDAQQRVFERENIKVNESLAFLNFGQQLIFNIGLFASMYYTMNQIMLGLMPVGNIVMVTSLLFQLAVPLNLIGTVYRETHLNLIDMQKLHKLMLRKPNVKAASMAKQLQLLGGNVSFRGVSFRYPGKAQDILADDIEESTPPASEKSEKTVNSSGSAESLARREVVAGKVGGENFNVEAEKLEFEASGRHVNNRNDMILSDITFDLPMGKRTAVVGTSGSGKSTLIKLLYRFYDVNAGGIYIDGQNIKELDLSYRDHIGVVPQDVVLFNDTLLFNLGYGAPNATFEEIQKAADMAQLTSVIKSLPQGYDTLVGERGLMLSGGEKQRVGIARCILRNPSIIVFDEATSALDALTERHILRAFEAISYKRTSLVIAHKLSTVASADQIIFLDKGSIAEKGTHEELMTKPNSQYGKLWKRVKDSYSTR